MKNSPRFTTHSSQVKTLKAWSSTANYRLIAMLLMALVFCGCKSKSKWGESNLPLPPGADTGIYDGQFVQTDYGFGFPLPSKWLYLRLSAEQEVDEVARFSDPTGEMIARVSVQLVGADQDLSKKSWQDASRQDLENHQFKIQKKNSVQEWKTEDSGPWIDVSYLVTDVKGDEWAVEEWALSKGGLLIGVHTLMPSESVGTE